MPIPLMLVVLDALTTAAAGIAVAAPGPAVADDPPAFHFADADRLAVDRTELTLTTDGADLRGTLRVVLSTVDTSRDDRSILIALPRGTEVRTLAVTIDEERLEGAMAIATAARSAYENTVERMTDPALLEWVRTSDQETWMRLRVFPVRPGYPATINLDLALPRTTTVAIDGSTTTVGFAMVSVDNEAIEWRDLDGRFAFDLPDPAAKHRRTTPRPQFVRQGVSLVAGPTILAGRETCPDGEFCLRMVKQRAATQKPRSLQARAATHRMRLLARGRRAR